MTRSVLTTFASAKSRKCDPTSVTSRLAEAIAVVLASGLSQQVVSDRLCISTETLRRMRLGQSSSSMVVSRFCDAFGVSGEWLLMGIGPMLRADVVRSELREASISDICLALAAQSRRGVFVKTRRMVVGASDSRE